MQCDMESEVPPQRIVTRADGTKFAHLSLVAPATPATKFISFRRVRFFVFIEQPEAVAAAPWLLARPLGRNVGPRGAPEGVEVEAHNAHLEMHHFLLPS